MEELGTGKSGPHGYSSIRNREEWATGRSDKQGREGHMEWRSGALGGVSHGEK